MSLMTFMRGTVLLALVSVTMTAAQQQKSPVVSKEVTVKATIEAIDKANRTLTLKGPKGNLVDVKADESVKRFDELKVGDVISATYSESIAVNVRKPGEPEPQAGTSIARSQGKPGAKVEDVQTATVTVEEIDRTVPSVTVKDSEGKVYSFRVQDPKRLEGLKVGDKVDIYYTVALLLKVD